MRDGRSGEGEGAARRRMPGRGGVFLGKVAGLATGGALYVVIFGLVLAWGSALVRWTATVGEWTRWEWTGGVAGLAWAGLCVGGLGVYGRRWSERMFVAVAVGVALAAGLAWALATRGMGRWPMDSGLFRWFLERLAEGGFAVENLRGLAGKTDYVLWVDRALPLYPLRLWAGSVRFGLAVQVAQAVAGALGTLAAWRATRVLAGARVARWTVTAIVSMPAAALQVVGMNHQVWGSLYFVAGIWLLAEWMYGGDGRKTRVVLFLLSLVVVPALCLEGYAGKMFVIVATILLGGEWVRNPAGRRKAVCAFVSLVVLPGMLAWGGIHVLHNRLNVLDGAPSHGGQLAFFVRGLGTEVWGEYAEDLDWVDILTPAGEKNAFFKRFIASQCAWNGKILVTRLFPAKLAKFMLVGYASLGEEVLWTNGAEEAARAAKGARVAWFLVFGALGVVGLRMMDKRALQRRGGRRVAWLVVPVAMFAVAVVLAGETSPRYSMPVQPLLFAAAAWGLCEEGPKRKWGKVDKNAGFPGFLAAAAGCALVAAAVVFGGRVMARWALLDMREAVLDRGETVADAAQAPYEARFPGGGGSVTWRGKGGTVAAYAWGAGWRDKGEVEVRACEDGEWSAARLPMRVVAHWRDGAARRLELRRTDGKQALSVGYASETTEGAGEEGAGTVRIWVDSGREKRDNGGNRTEETTE